MKATIYCKSTDHDVHSFYLEADGKTHYLFSQPYKYGVRSYFSRGVHLDAAIDFSRAGKDTGVIHTMEKLPSYIKYIEKEYGIAVLRRTARKRDFDKRCVA